jgi:roadblock/LC7 domain-containing protein
MNFRSVGSRCALFYVSHNSPAHLLEEETFRECDGYFWIQEIDFAVGDGHYWQYILTNERLFVNRNAVSIIVCQETLHSLTRDRR